MAFEQVFQDAIFKSYIFRLRAKTETYNVSYFKAAFVVCITANVAAISGISLTQYLESNRHGTSVQ